MPFHRVPRATAHEDIATIQREGEIITFLVVDGDHYAIVTEYPRVVGMPPRHAAAYETRATA